MRAAILAGVIALALIAAWTDWRSRRIPNWLTVSGVVLGLALNIANARLLGLKASLFGLGLALLLLLPFVLLRSLGAGDWKLAGAVGAFVGPGILLNLLVWSVFVVGAMALVLVIYKGRVRETLRNMKRLLFSLATFRQPGDEVSLDNPHALKVPYGVALALTVVLWGVGRMLGRM